MSRPHIPIKAKRNNFTLTKEAQAIIDLQKNKSKFVSDAILNYDPRTKEKHLKFISTL